MMLPSMLRVVSFLYLSSTALGISWSKGGCKDKCGNVTIPYPFGIGPGCSANSSFVITCNGSTYREKPFLSRIDREVLYISLQGVVVVNQPVSPMSCSGTQRTETLPISLTESPFTISALYNSLVVLGCTNSVWVHANDKTTVTGCLAICEANSLTGNSCSGLNCCNSTIPTGLKSFRYSYQSNIQNSNGSYCGYAFPANKEMFKGEYKRYGGLQSNLSYPNDPNFVSAPLVLEWELDNQQELDSYSVCRYAEDYRYYTSPGSDYTDPSTAPYLPYYDYDGPDYVFSTKYCSCRGGYEGNPYISGGCTDVDECALDTTESLCPDGMICINYEGTFGCDYPEGRRSKAKIAFISIGSGIGALILVFVVWNSAKAIRKRIEANRRHQFFKRNGGLLLQQELSSTHNSLEKSKLFSYKELARATDHFNEDRILGRGGQGTVYKGMLTDGRILAIKKSRKVEERDLHFFINEVVILSQINHRNVVKLLGCCLEAEVPLLVYEFIPNGTLFQHIHDPSEDFSLSWEMRVRIAREVAGALAYLHSAASVPIYHRDIKSTNILLDDKYRAKISDFGASRSLAIDQTHLTTQVLGTFGYLDPEYFHSSQFTEKSDVYSFGVVVVELLTGEKAVSSIRAEVGMNLASHFLHSMEEDRLFDNLDARLLREGKREEIMGVAHLARRCLHPNGKRRPTMKEVAVELERVQMMKIIEEDFNKDNHVVEVDESYEDFSSITESIEFN